MYAVLAASAAHMEHCGLKNDERALDLHSQALQGLAQLIADEHTSRDEALAVIIMLIYYEVGTRRCFARRVLRTRPLDRHLGGCPRRVLHFVL
jgi:hypothetical protein